MGDVVAEVASTDLPGFPPSTVPGHAGGIRSIAAPGGRRVLAYVGRVHGYEGHQPERGRPRGAHRPRRRVHAPSC